MGPRPFSSSSTGFSSSSSSGTFGAKEITSLGNSSPGFSCTETPCFYSSFPSGACGITGSTLDSNTPSTFPCRGGDWGFTGTTFNGNSTSAFACSGGCYAHEDKPDSFSGIPRACQQAPLFGVSSSPGFSFSSVPTFGTSVFGRMPLSPSASPFGERESSILPAFVASPSTSSLQTIAIPFGGSSTSCAAQSSPSFGFCLAANTLTPPEFAESSQIIKNANVAASKPNFFSVITNAGMTPATGGCSARVDKANFGDSSLKHEQTLPSFGFSSSPHFGMSRCEVFSFPPVSSCMASVSSEIPLSSDLSSFCPSSSKFCPTTTSASTFGSNSTSISADSNPSISVVASNGLKPDCCFSTKNVHLTPSIGGFGQFDMDQCRGSRIAPYAPTPFCDYKDSMTSIMISISAMYVYYGKSHEELRFEDYQQRNMDFSHQQPSLSSYPFGSHSSASDLSGFLPRSSFGKSTTTSAAGNLSAGASNSESQDKPGSRCSTCRCNQPTAFSQMDSGFNPPAYPFGTPQNGFGSRTYISNVVPGASQGTSVGFNAQPFGPGAAYGTSFLPAFVNYITPDIGALGFAAQHFEPVSWIPVFSFPALVTYPPAIATICPPLFMPSFGTSVGFNGRNGAPTSTTPESTPRHADEASSNLTIFGHCRPDSHPAPTDILRGTSVGLCGLNETKNAPSARPEFVTIFDNEVTDPEIVATGLADLQIKEKEEGDSDVPNGLRIIIEKLGVNPWAKGRHGKGNPLDYPSGWILPCEEAKKDADILALAQFAVEQHNAMDKDGKVEFVGVTGACLEPVGGGRYHIVLEAKDATDANAGGSSGKQKRYYASVLRNLNQLAVLEKWLPGEA